MATINYFQSGNNGKIQWSENSDYWDGDIDSADVPKDKCKKLCAKKKRMQNFYLEQRHVLAKEYWFWLRRTKSSCRGRLRLCFDFKLDISPTQQKKRDKFG